MCRIVNIASAGLLGLVFIAPAAIVVSVANEAQAQESAILKVAAVLAMKERGTFDPRLESLRADLRSLPFRSYSLLASRSCAVSSGEQCGMNIPANRFLQITATESTPNHLRLRLVLNHANRAVVNADLKLSRNAGILIKSNSRTHGGSTVLISIKTMPAPQ
jgi:hypothetical protein